ncbi:hypothetical protein EDB81DRAFT_182524 [Dactylonectria macrodidyma]|uniref:Uncharacterized protein n=1 Tax=Dactylonectria macrodidyma TaxID=307937 RepID=A0A9P9FR86_9HYPO|nr:hypothetical protein EDB81DRAFT_182524 [Dactylonectria macrodidyma]
MLGLCRLRWEACTSKLLQYLPQTLRNLVLFEEFNEDFDWIYRHNYITAERPIRPELIRTPSLAVGLALESRSLLMTTLSAS